MNAKFSQEKREDEIVTDIEIKPFAGVKKLNYKSSFWLPWKRVAEKKSLIKSVNELINDFNRLNDDLLLKCMYQDDIAKTALKSRGLLLHRNYLIQYLHEMKFNIVKLSQRLAYNRTKEFEKFLKSLQGGTRDDILKSISEFRKKCFSKFTQQVRKGVIESCNYIAEQIVRRHLKTKQKSRQQQLKVRFKKWEEKLGNNDKSLKHREFKETISSLVEILSGKTVNLKDSEIQILENCFSSNRNWVRMKKPWKDKMVKEYNPFPNLNDETNRVMIGLYGMVTDRDGKDIDPLINKYLV